MGFDDSLVQLLCGAKRRGVDFDEVATLGRQWFFPSRPTLDRVLKGLNAPPSDAEKMKASPTTDTFLEILGARRVDSIDYSAYEGATIIQDLNAPLAPELRNRFGVLIDGGTMEHVFNVPQALRNAMGMVRVGGWFIQLTVANNLLGHGFWQFSPELMFRCFSPENGFDPPVVLLKEQLFDDSWHECRDPKEVGGRVVLKNSNQTYICVLARKRRDVEPFATPPYQSDYVAQWNEDGAAASGKRRNRAGLRQFLPMGVRSLLKSIAIGVGAATSYDPGQYRRVPLESLLRGEFGRPPRLEPDCPATDAVGAPGRCAVALDHDPDTTRYRWT